MPKTLCPTCGYPFDAASNLGSSAKRPKVGDFSLCLNCGQFGRFALGYVIEKAEISDVLNPEQQKIVTASQQFIRQRGPLPSMRNPTRH
jgi:hypothetical protein